MRSQEGKVSKVKLSELRDMTQFDLILTLKRRRED